VRLPNLPAVARNLVALARGRRLARRLAAPRLLRAFADAYPRATFVEIGSNDGEQHDHLRPFILERDWRGLMVEPVPHVFERLQRNYGAIDRVTLVNAAVGACDGTVPFYYPAPPAEGEHERLPDWYDGIGSLSREAVVAHAKHIPDIEARVVREDVECLTYASLCRRHGLAHVDLLLIDTEGHDWEILRSLDLSGDRPRLIVYEHFHLSADDRRSAREHLAGAGYETLEEGFDTFCLVPAADALTRTFRGLRPAVRGVSVDDEVA
jgi:FkbM family methyltransferase